MNHLIPILAIALVAVPQGSAQDEIAELVVEARQHLRSGEYEEAEALLEDVLAEDPGHPLACEQWGAYLLLRGRFAPAVAALRAGLSEHPADAGLQARLGEALYLQGSYAEAAAALGQAWRGPSPILRAGRLLGDCLRDGGDRDGARAAWEAVCAHASRVPPRTSAALYEVGKCCERLRRYVLASRRYVDAIKVDREDPAPHAALGNLNRLIYNDAPKQPNPRRELQKALDRNPLHLEANYALFLLYCENFQRDQKKRIKWQQNIERVNPRFVPLLLKQAERLFRDRRFEAAGKKVDAALAVNPHDPRTRSYEAVRAFVAGDMATFERIEKELLERDPAFGELYAILGVTIVDLYRFAEAIPHLEKAIALDADLFDAHLKLGQALANTGQIEAGLAALRRSKEVVRGILHPWRENMIMALDAVLAEYVVRRHGDFVFYFHPDGRPVYEEYMVPVYLRALKELSAKYGVQPPLPIHVQCFREFEDFSARTVGFTGFGALGVCFGNTITAVAPLAPEFRSRYCWMSTAWHEFAHVITIALSRGRIPRWLTEGLSTYEEKQLHPGYDRHLERELVDAYHNDEIYPIETLNEAFRGPRIIFGYYQGGLICEYLAREYSFHRIAEMVRLYGEDRSTSEIFQTCFGITPEEFDRRFREHVRQLIAPIAIVPSFRGQKLEILLERYEDDRNDIEAAELLAWQDLRLKRLVDAELRLARILALDPDHPRAWLLKGQLLLKRGEREAALAAFEKGFAGGGAEFFSRLNYAVLLEDEGRLVEAVNQLRQAAEEFPSFADASASPRMALYRLLLKQGHTEQAYIELERYCQIDGSAFEPRMQLAGHLAEKASWEAAEVLYREANYIDPFSRALHVRWGEALVALGRSSEARREYRIARTFDPSLDRSQIAGSRSVSTAPWGIEGLQSETEFRSETWAREGELLAGEGQRAEALTAVQRALKINPDNERARRALEALGEG